MAVKDKTRKVTAKATHTAKAPHRAVQREQQRVSSPRTKRDRNDKVRIHLILIMLGTTVAVLIHVIPMFTVLEPVCEAFPFAPSIVQEVVDWILGL